MVEREGLAGVPQCRRRHGVEARLGERGHRGLALLVGRQRRPRRPRALVPPGEVQRRLRQRRRRGRAFPLPLQRGRSKCRHRVCRLGALRPLPVARLIASGDEPREGRRPPAGRLVRRRRCGRVLRVPRGHQCEPVHLHMDGLAELPGHAMGGARRRRPAHVQQRGGHRPRLGRGHLRAGRGGCRGLGLRRRRRRLVHGRLRRRAGRGCRRRRGHHGCDGLGVVVRVVSERAGCRGGVRRPSGLAGPHLRRKARRVHVQGRPVFGDP
mmetsp:Transcript_53076/g.153044  ORF Transcript_53076/g.153044 Transcript_53076/m.153044 type:complete len:267 (+) Transcript_53076:495-1295(+)